jgi:hypothetical protein
MPSKGNLMGVDDRAVLAANNNADLYEAMFASKGLRYDRRHHAFVGKDTPPPYYSNLTVLAPDHNDAVTRELLVLAAQFGGNIGLKDSFCELNLQGNGFSELFAATWIWRAAGTKSAPCTWQRVKNSVDLRLWEEAWMAAGSPTPGRVFEDALLHMPGIYFLGLKNHGVYESGCIANKSGDCIGISNVFSRFSSDAVYAEATAAVASIDPALPIVGYEAGTDLEHAHLAGFEATGKLRILTAKAASF